MSHDKWSLCCDVHVCPDVKMNSMSRCKQLVMLHQLACYQGDNNQVSGCPSYVAHKQLDVQVREGVNSKH